MKRQTGTEVQCLCSLFHLLPCWTDIYPISKNKRSSVFRPYTPYNPLSGYLLFSILSYHFFIFHLILSKDLNRQILIQENGPIIVISDKYEKSKVHLNLKKKHRHSVFEHGWPGYRFAACLRTLEPKSRDKKKMTYHAFMNTSL